MADEKVDALHMEKESSLSSDSEKGSTTQVNLNSNVSGK